MDTTVGRTGVSVAIAAVTLAAVAFVVAGATPAHAASLTCGATTTVEVQGDETVTFRRTQDGVGTWLNVDTASDTLFGRCNMATVRDVLVVAGTMLGLPPEDTGNQTVVLDLAGGPFAPGVDAESTGVAEIEFHVSLGAGRDEVHVFGSEGTDRIRVGDEGMNLNNDDDEDVTYAGVEALMISARGGDDVVKGGGQSGTGGPATLPLTIYGGIGIDYIGGGNAVDALYGGSGNDTMFSYRDGKADTLYGNSGTDRAWISRGGLDRTSSVERVYA